MFYLYRGVKILLLEKEEEYNELADLQERMGDQLKGLYHTGI